MDISNKTAIVTGVSRGIGKAIVKQLLEKGTKVAGWGQKEPDFKHENFHFISTDVRKLESVNHAFLETTSHFGEKIDILINNAGLGYFGFFEDMPPEQFYELFEVNVYGIFHTCRLVIPQLKKQGNGHIINISSTAGLEGMQQVGAYSGTKHAVRGITESLFKELREFGVKVTAVYPGSVKTDFFRHSPGIKAHDNMMQADEVALQIIHLIETSNNFNINEIVFRPLKVK
jgi:NAD(P)-dependent dehydrogenase (short-subunit alcohol dehydrogenase family)